MIHVIQAVTSHKGYFEAPGIRYDAVPYPGFSRGFGEFMEKTWHMVRPCDWVMWQPHDIEMDYADLIKACAVSESHFWALSLTPDSYHSHKWTVNKGKGWREVPFVDLSPVYSYEFALAMSEHFGRSKSGWGLDVLFANHHKRLYGSTAHICDDYMQRHTKPLDSQNWRIDGLSPMDELQRIKNTL